MKTKKTKSIMRYKIFILLFSLGISQHVLGQEDTTKTKEPSKFDAFNKKAERLFTFLPVPLYSYSTEAGNIVGLAKFNMIRLDRTDTISQPSKISELVTVSSKGRVKVAVTTDLIWDENKYMVLGYIYFKKQEEYIFGIGNDVTIQDAEEFGYSQFRFSNTLYRRVVNNRKFYVGLGFDIADYTQIVYSDSSFLNDPDIIGNQPTTNFGFKVGAFLDKRDSRYTPTSGYFIGAENTFFLFDLNYQLPYTKTVIDVRKYFNPWYKHVIATQISTTFCTGNVPFYDLALMGGDSQMRGWYTGALRDNVLLDGQIEYRMPIWKIFGMVAWVGTGRVANSFEELNPDGFWISYGVGARIKVDSKTPANMRFDWGFGNNGVSQFYISFAEAF